MAYRESFESCPRCRVTLEDAGSVRACRECRGQWVLEPVLAEMVVAMRPPGVPGTFSLVPISGMRNVACPSCGIEMEAVSLYGVELDRCPKNHGVWFDPDELEAGLFRAADPPEDSSEPNEPATPEPASAPIEPPQSMTAPDPAAPWEPLTRRAYEPAPAVTDPSTPQGKRVADVIARMKRGDTFTNGYGRAFITYGWDAQTNSLYAFYQEDTYEHPRLTMSERELATLIADHPDWFT